VVAFVLISYISEFCC